MADFEYGFIVVGGDSGRPWGTKGQGFVQAPHLNLADTGRDLTNIGIAAGDETGNGKILTTDTALVPNKEVGKKLRLGTTAAPLAGVATVIANDAVSITVNWSTPAASSGTFQGYLVREDYDLYPEVRVLVPYQPEGDGTNAVPYPTDPPTAPPGFTLPAAVSTHEDWGLFLPFSFAEGIASHGISEGTDSYTAPSTHPASGATGSTFTLASGVVVADAFVGGYIRVTHGASLELQSWARIASNTTLVFTLDAAGWIGDGTPSAGTPSTWLFEAWVPHWANSPAAYLPGAGFRYPSNDMQPSVGGDGRILNLPRRITTPSYGDRFGPVLEFGYRMAAQLNRRVNIIHLSVNDSTLIPRTTENMSGFIGTLGWWDHSLMSDWTVSKSGGLADRLDKLITTVAPNALVAEGVTVPLRILGIAMFMGEGDVQLAAGRELYARSMSDFIAWLRGVVVDAGLSPYDPEQAEIPVVHPLITTDPWVDTYDEDDFVNGSIREIASADQFVETIETDDSPKLFADSSHFNGVGEALNGNLVALELAGLVNNGLSFGSDTVVASTTEVLRICNLALSYVGELPIASLTENTAGAQNCSRYYAQARDELLEEFQWVFAMKRVTLVPTVSDPPSTWMYSYVVPADALSLIAVLDAAAAADYTQSTAGSFSSFWEMDFPNIVSMAYTPQPYAVEQGPAGYRVLYTNVRNAVLRYVPKIGDATRFSKQFSNALSYRLAYMLAGTIVRGTEGVGLSQRLLQRSEYLAGKAAARNGMQRKARARHVVPWHARRS